MSAIDSLTLEVPDVSAAERFYADLGVGEHVRLAPADDPSTGFRAFTLSLICSQPADADLFAAAAADAGARVLKPVARSFWGYGGVIEAPDGTIWKLATSSKKNRVPAVQRYDELVMLIGAADVKTSKAFYVQRGLPVDKSFANKYVQFDTGPSPIKLGLYGYEALAKDAGVPAEGSGSHRVVLSGGLGTFSDPDGFSWA